jgi:phage terminase large subunit-like protein
LAGPAWLTPPAAQRPPKGDWRTWAYIGGRGVGKSQSGARWVQHRVETGVMRLGCLIAPTAAALRLIASPRLENGSPELSARPKI